ncbi:hypothetical protein REH65_31260 [Saccharopolyspora sp. ID03-671]|uniref:hypothetical protein n=1 Tax=Saccharopolyspora sp. ID03-671 TaxID=3073066 RepID=UPI0032568C73
MTPEEEKQYIATITSREHTRIADEDHRRREARRPELERRGLIPNGLKTPNEKKK